MLVMKGQHLVELFKFYLRFESKLNSIARFLFHSSFIVNFITHLKKKEAERDVFSINKLISRQLYWLNSNLGVVFGLNGKVVERLKSKWQKPNKRSIWMMHPEMIDMPFAYEPNDKYAHWTAWI